MIKSPISRQIAIVLTQMAVLSSTAHAQYSDTAGAQQGSGMLEEIIVTAERREASLQETDISMSVFTSDTLQELGISNYGDIGDYAPNVMMQPTAAGRSGYAVSIRGVKNGETVPTFEPKVALYLDGVLIAKNAGSLLDIVELERVEILRGPQGTLYGRNTVGGAVNLVTKKPDDEIGGALTASLGDYSQRDLKGTINLPLVGPNGVLGNASDPVLNFKLDLATLNQDGYWDNGAANAPNSKLGDADRTLAHMQLQWQPADTVSLLYAYDRTDVDETGTPYHLTQVNPDSPFADQLTPYIISGNPSTIYHDSPGIQETEVDGHSLTADFDLGDTGILGGVTLTSITALRTTKNTAMGDADGTPNTILHSTAGFDFEQFTQEFRLVGSSPGGNLDYVIGAYYLEEDTELYYGNILGTAETRTEGEAENEVWALYGEGTYNLTDSLDLTLGLRYTEEDRQMQKRDLLGLPRFADRTIVRLDPPGQSDTWSDVSGTVSLSYQWSDALMTYGKVSKGYASGGFNVRAASAADFANGYDEETLIAYELGWKYLGMDGRLLVNGAIFYSDYKDLQSNLFDPETRGNNIQNAGDAEITGGEVEIVARPLNSLDLGLSYGYTDAKYKTYIDALGNDLSDNNFPHTPENNINLWARVVISDLQIGQLSGRLDWIWQDDINFLALAPERNFQESYSVVNGRVSLEQIAGPGDSQIRISLWGRNLTDEDYWNSGVNLYDGSLGYNINTLAPPRTYGVDFTVDL